MRELSTLNFLTEWRMVAKLTRCYCFLKRGLILKNSLNIFLLLEEIHWKQRAGKYWVLQGDANTQLFHQFANGRRRKSKIIALQADDVEIQGQSNISKHIVSFYKELFGHSSWSSLKLGSSFWPNSYKVSESDSALLVRMFEEKKIMLALSEMKCNSAPGPNGFSMLFFKKFWGDIKDDVMNLFNDFWEGQLDIKRLNYGVISLVPKVKETINITQFRPICLLNVDYKWFTKVLTERLVPVAENIIDKNQIGFVRGRNILERVVVLHEVLHELKRSKKGA